MLKLLQYLFSRSREWYTNNFGSLIKKFTGSGLTGAEQEANQFTAAQAEQARQFQEDMYVKYQSPQAMMRQYADAGLNPALMYSGAGSLSQSFSSPAGSSVSPGSGLNLLDSLASLMRVNSEVQLNDSQRDLNEANAGRARAETARTEKLTDAEYSQILANVDYQRAGISKYDAETALALSEVALRDIDAKSRERYNEILILEKQAAAAESAAASAELYQRIQNEKQQFAVDVAREAEIKANTNVLNKTELQILRENELIYWNTETARYEANIKQFEDSKKESNRVWRLIGEGAGIARDAGVGYIAVKRGASSGASRSSGTRVGTTPDNLEYPYMYLN